MPAIDAIRAALADRYAFDQPLGEGGMATVWRARDLKHDRLVALKVLRPELAEALGTERFLAEVRIAANLQHPHILPLFDSGEVAGVPWYAMPLVAGEALRDRLDRERTLAVPEAVRIARQVAAALAHAHARGVVHRDVKPENLLLHEGNVYVADFGIALAVHHADTGRITRTGVMVGTPRYMSPEQLSGERSIDGRSDQWALGAILYEMLAGEPPHSGATLPALVARIVTEPPTALSAVRPGVPAALESAVMRALAKSPADRFATTEQFEEALARAVTAEGPVAAAPGTAPGAAAATHAPARRGPLIAAVATAVVALVAYVMTGDRPAGAGPSSAVVIAVPPCEDRTGDTSLAYIADGMSENLVNRLTRVSGLEVIPRGVVRSVARPGDDPIAVARAVGATHLVACSVARAAGGIRLGAQLVQAEPPRELWGDGGTAEPGGLLAIEDSLLQRVVASVPVRMSAEDARVLAAGDTRDGEAQRLVLLGRHLWHRFSAGEMQTALRYFEQAVARDSGYARAYAGIVSVHIGSAMGTRTVAVGDARQRALAALEQGLRRRPGDADLLAMRTMIALWFDRDLPAARRFVDQALAAGTASYLPHQSLQHWYAAMGELDSALASNETAMRLEPGYGRLYTDRATYLVMAGRFADALRMGEQGIALDQRSTTALMWQAYAHAFGGDLPAARSAYGRFADLAGGAPAVLADRAVLLALLGERTAARALLDTIDRAPAGRVDLAVAAAAAGILGDTARAFGWLDRAEREGSRYLLTIGVDPRFDALRADPRLAAYARRVRGER